MRPAVFVPESKRLNVLLKDFRRNRNHMAIVVDEYGGVAGLCTIEDVIEQIVGDIDDEFDVEDDQNIRRDAERQFTVRGVTRIDEFNEYFGAQLSEEQGVDTIAGLLMKQLGRLPRRGESCGHRRLRVPRAARRPAPHRRAARGRPARRASRRKSGRPAAPFEAGAASDGHRGRHACGTAPLATARIRAPARAARARGGRGARRFLCAAEPVAARGPRPGAADVAVAGRGPAAKPRAWGSGSASEPSPPAPTGCTSASTSSVTRRSGSRCC